MKKKYQVFISSTYSDLIEERAAATQSLLDNDCIPVGMEQFPASEMSQMEYIKRMLDDCDYYILILGGRYGSLDNDGIGFTEKEYDYAISKGIPVMSFVFDKPENLPSKKCETTDSMREKYATFRAKVCSGRLVKFHSDIGTLKANIVTAVNHCIRDFPAIGWVRGNGDSEQENLLVLLESSLAKYKLSDSEREEYINKIRTLEIELKTKPTIASFLNEFGGETIVINGGSASIDGKTYIEEQVLAEALSKI